MKKYISAILAIMIIITISTGMIGVVKAEDTFKVGMEVNYAPYNWSQVNDEDGAVPVSNSPGEYANGYDVAIAKIIADKLGKKLEIVKTEWDGLIPGILSKKLDAIIAGMSPTNERKEKVDFTDKYYTSDLVLVVKKDGPYDGKKDIQDFNGARVTGQLNTFHYTVIDQIKGVKKLNAMEDFPAMLVALKAGKIDAYVSERPGALSAQASNPDITFCSFDKGKGFKIDYNDTSIAVGLTKNSSLLVPINKILSSISDEQRSKIMSDKVNYQAKLIKANNDNDKNVSVDNNKSINEDKTFWQAVGFLIDKYGSLFLHGAWITMLIAIVSTIVGFIIGLIVSMIKCIPKASGSRRFIQVIIKFILNVYIEVFRSTPMIVQAVLFYYGSKLLFNIDINPLAAAFIVVSINTGAYLSEVVRSGINSIDNGQFEAAKAIGMTHFQTMVYVVLPQAVKNILPAIGNEFVINIKDTAVLNVISVTELFFTSKSVAGSTYLIFESYLITCAIYFVLTFTVTRIILLIENKLKGNANYELVQGGDLHE